MIVLVSFAVLLVLTKTQARTRGEWLIDGSGLAFQGAIAALFSLAVPHGRLDIPPLAQFALSFLGVDYLFYWNHRLLHRAWWRWHSVHHTARRMDVVVTSRNTLWTPLLMVYLWTTAAAVLLFRDPRGYLLGVSVTAALDLWRHSSLALPPRLRALASLAFITPHEHAWHHSSTRTDVNFGANFSLWDRLHRTYASPGVAPESLGVDLAAGTARRLLAGAR
jgi:sterol desaturase/sphingolipid hydroxylase (fatty acid hydroxylase superfamily)